MKTFEPLSNLGLYRHIDLSCKLLFHRERQMTDHFCGYQPQQMSLQLQMEQFRLGWPMSRRRLEYHTEYGISELPVSTLPILHELYKYWSHQHFFYLKQNKIKFGSNNLCVKLTPFLLEPFEQYFPRAILLKT